MDIDKLIETETARERALYERVKALEREMEPAKRRYEDKRAQWSEVYNRVKVLKQMKEMMTADASAAGEDAAVLVADQAELAREVADAADAARDATE